MPTVNQLVRYLLAHHVGKSRAITARDLATYYNISDGSVEVEMRKIIRDAVNGGDLIGSCSRGYYIINNIREIDHNLNSLRSRASETLVRRQNLRNQWNTRNPSNPTALPDINPNI